MSDEANATMEVVPSITRKERRQEPSCVEFNLHACYYSDLFLLRTSIYTAVNGTLTEMKLHRNFSKPYIHNPEVRPVSIFSLQQYSRLAASILIRHGVNHVDTYYYEQAPLLSVAFEAQDQMELFLSKTDTVQSELQDATTSFLRLKTFPKSTKFDDSKSLVYIKCELFLVAPMQCNQQGEPKVHQITLENFCQCLTRWKGSKVFDFCHQLFTDTSNGSKEGRFGGREIYVKWLKMS